MTDKLLQVGTILGSHGLKGTLSVYSDTRPASGIAGYSCWYLGKSEATVQAFEVRRCWQHGKGVLVELEGVCDRNAADALKKMKIWVNRDEVEVDDDEYLWQDLVGCAVYADERLLGWVTALEAYGAQDILCVQAKDEIEPSGEWLLPFTEQVVQSIDTDARRIEVELLDGMDACFTPKS